MSRPTREQAGCPYEYTAQALKRIGGRWKTLIVRRLLEQGPTNWPALLSTLPGISPKMLTQQLRELVADGIVLREELDSSPPKAVVYELTLLGQDLAPVLQALAAWGKAATSENSSTAFADAASR